MHHLTLAVLADPKNAMARGLLGLVAHEGRWLRPEVVAEKTKADADRAAALAEYETRRQKAPYTADGQWLLGLWAEEHGLKEQARAHLTAVTRLDPKREQAWKKLGYKKHEGRWVTDAQLAAEKAEAEAQKLADKKWKPLLEKYKAMLDQPSKRDEAENALAEITDPRAVPMIVSTFAKDRPKDQLRAIQLLSQIDSPLASKTLAYLGLFASSAEAKKVSIEILRNRDAREYMGLLVGLIRDPIKYEVKPVGGPGSPGELFIDGKKAKVRRFYSPPSAPSIAFMPGDILTFDLDGSPVLIKHVAQRFQTGQLITELYTPAEYTGRVAVTGERKEVLQTALANPSNSYGDLVARQNDSFREVSGLILQRAEWKRREGLMNNITVIDTHQDIIQEELDIPIGKMMAESQKTALLAQQQLASDVRGIEQTNAVIKDVNGRVRSILGVTTGQDLGDDQEAWRRAWVDRQGYVYRMTSTTPPPTTFENVPLNYMPVPVSPMVVDRVIGSTEIAQASLPAAHSCFAAGTMVRTIDGERPIESIQAGDLVLVQDTKNGALGYQSVVTVYHNPPNATLRIALGGSESVVATGIHRFWKAGRGWTMARELKVGDRVRTLGGVATVESIVEDRVQPVFNLEVGEGHSFLVGKVGALVHDNSLVEATPNPFDAETKTSK